MAVIGTVWSTPKALKVTIALFEREPKIAPVVDLGLGTLAGIDTDTLDDGGLYDPDAWRG